MTVDAEFGDALPIYLTRFVGRGRECAEVARMLRRPGVVTVCGVGGAGKTRLAVEVARRRRTDDGLPVCWVSLATTLDAGGAVPAIAHGLGLSGIAPLDQLRAALGSRLLVLDNCEHLAGTAGRCSPGSGRAAVRCGCWPPAGSRSACRTSGSTRFLRWAGRPGRADS